jgi:ATP-dependent protease HslVU (ClpYQ) peptidase subunit
MTCVVAKPGLLCTDSRETGTTKRDAPKHFRKHDYLVGTAGDCAALTAAEHVMAWPKKPSVRNLTRLLHKHQDSENCDFGQVSMVVVTRETVLVIDGLYVYEAAAGAIGSGAPYALGYLRAAPEDLEGAVAAACFYDPYCAGPIRKIEL